MVTAFNGRFVLKFESGNLMWADVGHPWVPNFPSFQPKLQIMAQLLHQSRRRGNMCHQIFLWAAGLALAGSNTTCLPNAAEELDRKELVNLVSGQSYAIGLWRNGDYPAAHLTARVVQIIIQETK